MPQSLAHNLIHLIFSTKLRQALLTPAVIPELNSYVAGILREHDCPAILVNSVADHMHCFFVLSKSVALSKIVEQVKSGSSKWIKTKGPEFRGFAWQNGYAAFGRGISRYIEFSPAADQLNFYFSNPPSNA